MVNRQKIITMTKLALYDKHEGAADRAANDYFRHDYIYRKNLGTRICVGIAGAIVLGLQWVRVIFVEGTDIFEINIQDHVLDSILFILALVAVYSLIGTIQGTREYYLVQKRLTRYQGMLRFLENAEERAAKPEPEDAEKSEKATRREPPAAERKTRTADPLANISSRARASRPGITTPINRPRPSVTPSATAPRPGVATSAAPTRPVAASSPRPGNAPPRAASQPASPPRPGAAPPPRTGAAPPQRVGVTPPPRTSAVPPVSAPRPVPPATPPQDAKPTIEELRANLAARTAAQSQARSRTELPQVNLDAPSARQKSD